MFFRTKVVKDRGRAYEYVQLVESYRDEKRITRQRVLKSLGRRDQLDPAEMEALIESYRRVTGHTSASTLRSGPHGDPDEDIEVLESRRFGDVFVLRRVWDDLGLKEIFDGLAAPREFQFDLGKALFTMVANRALDPRSKLDTIEWAKLDVLLPESSGLTETHLYRTLTWLDAVKSEAEKSIFARIVRGRSTELRLVLYDTSPVHFETEDGPALAQHGRPSRAPRNKKIVLVALVTTFDGWPIYHHVFPGATADVSTVRPVLETLREVFQIGRVVVLADNGMVSKETLALLDALKFDYMVAMKLKRGTAEVKKQVLGRAGRYREVDPNLHAKEVFVDDRRYVVCYNPDEDARDKARREGILGKLRTELAKGVAWSSQAGAEIRANAGYRRYVVPGRGKHKGQIVLSKTRIKADSRYDGTWVVHTSRHDITSEDVACLYKSEGEIERDWRDLKSVIGLRPVRHFTDRNVRGHVFVCVLAKLLLREIQRRLDQTFAPVGSPPTVLENLGRIPAVQLKTPRRTFWKTATLKDADLALLRAVGVDPASVPRIVEGVAPVMPSRFAAPELANAPISDAAPVLP